MLRRRNKVQAYSFFYVMKSSDSRSRILLLILNSFYFLQSRNQIKKANKQKPKQNNQLWMQFYFQSCFMQKQHKYTWKYKCCIYIQLYLLYYAGLTLSSIA